MKTLRIGCGAGYSGDRIEPAVELAEKGDLDYLVFECLAERTIALAQLDRLSNPKGGYDPLLLERMRRVLPFVHGSAGRGRRLRVITNMGAANPAQAAKAVAELATYLGFTGLRIVALRGDDVLATLQANPEYRLDNGQCLADLGNRLVSANAYLGVDGIVGALAADADIVITGRVADPSLFLAPQIFEFGWALDDWARLGQGTLTGHLLECAGQITGGYFADPGRKHVPDLARLGFPIAQIDSSGQATLTKVHGSGGRIDRATCTEQVLYEVHDPACYLTPDVSADFSTVDFRETGENQVLAFGAIGQAKPEHLKVSVGFLDGWIGEGQMAYGGPNAVARAQLAGEIVQERLRLMGVPVQEVRVDLIGMNALYGDTLTSGCEPSEVRLRVTARCATQDQAVQIGNEVETLYTNGPAGGGGASKQVRHVVAVASLLLPRSAVALELIEEVS